MPRFTPSAKTRSGNKRLCRHSPTNLRAIIHTHLGLFPLHVADKSDTAVFAFHSCGSHVLARRLNVRHIPSPQSHSSHLSEQHSSGQGPPSRIHKKGVWSLSVFSPSCHITRLRTVNEYTLLPFYDGFAPLLSPQDVSSITTVSAIHCLRDSVDRIEKTPESSDEQPVP